MTIVARRRSVVALLAQAGLLVACQGTPAATPQVPPGDTGSPDQAAQEGVRGVVALGHSGLTGEGSDPDQPGADMPENSWATGTNPDVNSIYQRLVEARPETEGQVHNAAQGGAAAAALPTQADTALAEVPAPELVIIETIDSDIRCDGSDPDYVPEFGASLQRALESITAKSPDSTILLVSGNRPAGDIEAFADRPDIRQAFGGTGMCYFFGPEGNVDEEALETLTGIIEAYEAEQERVCEMFANCHTDDGLAASYVPELDHLVADDWNHLSIEGHAAMAELIWPRVAEILDVP